MKDEPILLIDELPPDIEPEVIHLMVDLVNLPPRTVNGDGGNDEVSLRFASRESLFPRNRG